MTDPYSKADESDEDQPPDHEQDLGQNGLAGQPGEFAEPGEGAADSDADVAGDDVGSGYEDDADAEYAAASEATGDDLRHLVLFVASSLVDRPEDVEVHAEQRGQAVQLTLIVPEDELGKVIGRQGRIARAIRTVTMIAGSRHNVRASLDIEG